jgi:hypothetical protein
MVPLKIDAQYEITIVVSFEIILYGIYNHTIF